MAAIVTLDDEAGGTRYTARARPWAIEARERHEAMGFVADWNQRLDQLVSLVATPGP